MFISNNINGTVMTFKENGDCGIGNTAPDAKFHIGNAQYANPINFQLQNDEGKLEIGIAKSAWDFAPNSQPGNAVFRVSGDENSMIFNINNDTPQGYILFNSLYDNNIMKILCNGNVGIGTPTPGAKLEIAGDLKIGNLPEYSSATNVIVDDGTGKIGKKSISSLGDNLGSHTATTNLNMAGYNILNGYAGNCFSILQNTSSSNGPCIEMYGIDNADPNRKGEMTFISYGNTGDFNFYNYNNSNWQHKFIIKADGNVGIGTSDPQSLLHIRKQGYPSTSFPGSQDALFKVQQSSNTDWAAEIYNNGGGGKGLLIIADGTSSGVPALKTQNVGGDIGLVVNSDGNVGIGTNSPSNKLHIKGTTNQDDLLFLEPGEWNSEGDYAQLTIGDGNHYIQGVWGKGMKFHDFNQFFFEGATPNTAELKVDGNIWAQKVEILQDVTADFVYNNDYKLMPLNELENYIDSCKHLPDIPSAEEMKGKSMNIGNFQIKLLQKIEEISLYVIQLKKENNLLKEEITKLKSDLQK
ncbi:MAG: hypothetical protein A2X08_13740 [Bacteroidetes bacterium GWA2_32_17]|nr:MAG: hypothetical protein A2X08_13740 [Bacteroidetes bacterium GWA2_32_17]